MELLTVLISGPAAQFLGQNGGGCFGCMVVSWPLSCSIPAAGLFFCAGHRATSGFSRMIFWSTIRMAQQLPARCGAAAGAMLGSVEVGCFGKAAQPTSARPGLVEPVRPSLAQAWWSQPRFPSPNPIPMAELCGPSLTSHLEDGEGLPHCKTPGSKKITFSSFLLS